MKRRSEPILRVSSKVLLPFIVLFGLYVQFHGDYGPGGGFQAGVIVATAFILYAIVFGLDRAEEVLTPRWIEVLVAAGVLLFAGVGVISLLKGGVFLDYDVLDHHSAVHGQHRGIFWVELGVGITVTAAITGIFFAFADRGRPE